MTINPSSVAVIDIGSNSIKVLVAMREAAGQVVALTNRTIDARISAGISHSTPRLTDENMALGLAAIKELLATAAPFTLGRIQLVATSAVRDASNGSEFRETVRRETGHEIHILSGEEEAAGIGRGLTCDPALASLQDFYVFDLGGGSLECLAFRARQPMEEVSLQLGCVRLTERFIGNSSDPLSAESLAQISAHTKTEMAAFSFPLSTAPAIGTGGTVTTVRSLLGARLGLLFEATPPTVTVAQLRELLNLLAPMSLVQRQQVPAMPATRADVFPVALATLIAVAEAGGLTEFRHSLYNLRYGLAARLLDTCV